MESAVPDDHPTLFEEIEPPEAASEPVPASGPEPEDAPGPEPSSDPDPEPESTAGPAPGSPDVDLLLEETADAEAAADAALDTLKAAGVGRGPRRRTHEERMGAVLDVVDAATPPREVRTPAERKAALERALAERMRRREVRTEEERRRAVAEVVEAAQPTREVRTPERRREDVEREIAGLMRSRQARSDQERLADARRAAQEALEQREAEKAALQARIEAMRAAKEQGGGGRGSVEAE